jgi:hypothetical protein
MIIIRHFLLELLMNKLNRLSQPRFYRSVINEISEYFKIVKVNDIHHNNSYIRLIDNDKIDRKINVALFYDQ